MSDQLDRAKVVGCGGSILAGAVAAVIAYWLGAPLWAAWSMFFLVYLIVR